VHGANRLGTNSLLDLLVFGKSSGDSVIEDLKAMPTAHKELPANFADKTLARLSRLENQTNGTNVNDTRLAMQRTMQNHCGVFRFKDKLEDGVKKILEIEQQVAKTEIKDKSKVWNTARIEALELDNLIEVAKATMICAEARKESRGAHVRDDAPDTPEMPNGRNDKEWHKHTLWSREGNKLSYKPVKMTPLSVETIALKTRSY
jgi:succinate dehydrogenase / fumarate reductase flavoprotein subunit